MEIELRLYGGLNRYAPDKQTCSTRRVPLSATVKDVVSCLGIPDNIHVTLLRNGRRVEPSTRLEPNDTLTLLPDIDGG
ncbi:MAG: hypothetical protein K9L23_18375 [Desulfotignum sp.]|nr:hypothetical protein [Desulfotignum sp.]